jgi:DNA-binding Lrp family transcriptional regulator
LDKKEEQKLQLLFTLIRGARRSDKELSKITGNTRATVTRRRRQLENEGYIKEYTVLPAFTKIGYELAALTFITWKASPTPEELELGKEWLSKQPWVVFAAGGEGIATNVVMSVHRNYADFSSYISALREDTQILFGDVHFFVIDLIRKETIFKHFSLTQLETNSTAMSKEDYRTIASKKMKDLLHQQSTRKTVLNL